MLLCEALQTRGAPDARLRVANISTVLDAAQVYGLCRDSPAAERIALHMYVDAGGRAADPASAVAAAFALATGIERWDNVPDRRLERVGPWRDLGLPQQEVPLYPWLERPLALADFDAMWRVLQAQAPAAPFAAMRAAIKRRAGAGPRSQVP